MGLKARVHNGWLVMDEPCDLPEGTELDLVVEDEGDDLDPEDRAALHATLLRSIEQVEHGETRSAEEVLADLRKRKAAL